jgi:tetratricopeptide (TPR) repeat protein
MKQAVMFFLVMVVGVTYAKPIEITPVDKGIVTSLFGGEWRKSDSLINVELARSPNHPKYYFLKAYHSLYSRMIGSAPLTRDQSIELIKNYAWKGITVGQRLEQTSDVKFYVAYAYHFLCRANVMRQEYWTAYWNAKKCRNLLEEVIKEDPSNEDAYFALGITEYYPPVALTGFKSTLVWFGGMSGDRVKGLQYLERAAAKGNLFQDEAKFVLGIAYRNGENNLEKALACWEELMKRYPSVSTFKNSFYSTNLVVIVNQRGAKFLEDEYDTIKEKYHIELPYFLISTGSYLLSQKKYQDAIIALQVNSRLYPHVANTYINLGECYLQQKDRPNAAKYYGIANEKLPADTTVSASYRETLQKTISEKLSELGAGGK